MGDLTDANLLPKKEALPGSYALTVDEVCRIVRSGDIVLFSGKSLTSWFVTVFCASQWSHIGIVYREGDGDPLLFESIKSDDDGSPNIDVRTGKHRVGVRLVNLRLLLESFDGYAVAVRTLITPVSMNAFRAMDEHMTRVIAECIQRFGYMPYEHRWINFFLARYDFVRLDCEVPDALFCSELVARCYKEAGLFTHSRSSLQYLPDDFSQVGEVHFTYPLERPIVAVGMDSRQVVRLSEELFVELPAAKKKKKLKRV